MVVVKRAKRGSYSRDKSLNLYIRATPEDAVAWREQADLLQVTLSEWIRRACNGEVRPSEDYATQRSEQIAARTRARLEEKRKRVKANQRRHYERKKLAAAATAVGVLP